MNSSVSAASEATLEVLNALQVWSPLQRYITTIALTLVCCEYITTFEQEVKFVWGARNTLPKLVFLICRYLTPLALVVTAIVATPSHLASTNFCRSWFRLDVAVQTTLMVTTDAIAALRLVALWGRSRTVLRVIFLTFGFSACATVAFITAAGVHDAANTWVFPIAKTCVIASASTLAGWAWAAGAVFDTALIGLTIVNALERPRMARRDFLLRMMLEDGFGYFVGTSLFRMLNIVCSFIDPAALSMLSSTISLAGVFIILGRFLFMIRDCDPPVPRDTKLSSWPSLENSEYSEDTLPSPYE